LIATKLINNPFEYADVVTFSTSGSFRGPKGSIIAYKVGSKGVNAKGVETFYDYK
jgi:glycine hydroxymethyltransferase